MTSETEVFLRSKFISESIPLTFDFTEELAASETISTQSVIASVYSGGDPNPQGIVSGSATASGKIVTQKIAAGSEGNIYVLSCQITSSLGYIYRKTGYLSVVPPSV